jgi:cytochrome c oxidase subunit II
LRLNHNVSRAAVYIGIAISLSDCTGPLSTLEPNGPASASIANLWWVMLAVAAGLFALVMILFTLVIIRPGWGSRTSPTYWIVLGGLCLPGIILTPLVAYALFVGEQLLPRSAAEPMRIQAVAHQWSWTFLYPGHDGIKTEGVMHLPAGVPVDVLVTSLDVIHAFWIPQLAGKIDAVPGHVNLLRIQADAPGRYQGLCNQFCGSGHSEMRFDVIVHPAADFYIAIAKPDAAGRVRQ